MSRTFKLPPLFDEVRAAAMELNGQEIDAALVAARLVDGLRDAQLPVPAASEWHERTGALVADEWARVEILTRLLREGSQAAEVAAALREDPKRIMSAFPEFCSGEARLLTLELLLKSPFRVEELVRKWIRALGGRIDGENEKESRERLERLDFGGVLNNLKAADADREVRMKKLKELEAKRLKEQQEAYARQSRE